ncbi:MULTISPECIES: Do family serine endopeptidase [unclassified Mucilaginibacter]|uniref:Do family serine endopeptidase n=1 Tax=unclassified Mucilaginibacter TaxID=2617802 RepID=UPI002AC9C533|nr:MULTISPECIES: Do family serine endopeptidase [unclassified Mucilaginibacter]MEB0262582.1 Do family serine endopeptidase [Mucilaginibacter sp. 10I4]MEB0278387.1 Do family serine endopeptidase [Mucilaginibacter sp. 10B2]MEB0303172.1 Do family serine endopeptidase [Mucilaginibacter sp. 5C4]WPX24032.1 Do family serine endopeptidase [Mucilaginibacter sp. 5C4]
MKKIGLTLLTAFVGGAMALGVYKLVENKYADSMSLEDKQKVYFASNRLNVPVTSSAGSVDFTQAAADVTPAVVYIRTTYSTKSEGNGQQDQLEQMFGQMFGQRMRPQGPQMASGSGVIISPDGYIVTNNHVVAKAEKITIVTNDHRSFEAKVIGTDPNTDLALIKIDGKNLPIVKLGNSDAVRVGEWVLAVGNPFKLNSTVTAGIVSAKGRSINIIGREDDEDSPYPVRQQDSPTLRKGIESFIQTDAAINPGNSGGALVNTAGELIGINAAIASHTGSYEGYGFAIPINLAKKVLNDIKKYGTVKRGYVGIGFADLSDPEAAKQVNSDKTNGLYVTSLVTGGGAVQAGVKAGDIITKVEGNPVYESSDLQERVARLQPGDKINITVLREGVEKNFNINLKAEAPVNKTAAVSKSAAELFNKLGASFQPLNAAQKSKFKVSTGVVVTQVRAGGIFDDTEIPVGSVITSINKQPISSVADMDRVITSLKNGRLIITGYYPDGGSFSNVFEVQ